MKSRLTSVTSIIVSLAFVLALAVPSLAKDLGHIRQGDILVKAYQALQEVQAKNLETSDALALFAVGEEAFEALDPELFTGYSVKDRSEAAGYDPTRVVRYGHASPAHLLELVAVMNYVLPENAERIRIGLERLAGSDFQSSVRDVWINNSFFEYLGGKLME